MAEFHYIRWKKEDYRELQKAVYAFNNKVKRLENLSEYEDVLPPLQSYKQKKKEIVTRQELYRYINSLKRFTKYGKPEITTLQSGIPITRWEITELKKAQKRVTRKA